MTKPCISSIKEYPFLNKNFPSVRKRFCYLRKLLQFQQTFVPKYVLKIKVLLNEIKNFSVTNQKDFKKFLFVRYEFKP